MPPRNETRGASGSPPRVAIIVSRYNPSVTGKLLAGAVACHEMVTGAAAPDVYAAPGSFELPVLARAAASSGRYDAVVALGCLIRGETRHDRYIADAVAHGLTQVSCDTGVPIAFGVLTVENAKQAKARAGGSDGNKGQEAMAAALEAAASISAINAGRPVRQAEIFTAPSRDKAGPIAARRSAARARSNGQPA